ncbi:hypothetical protein BDZ89DRAFT_246819 [Hymenopellis radicata]|nr:hypothetical protein BDZ89DRAFT_246819 [Hymenopellis radicata]
MSTSRLTADLGILAKNALRDGASFQKFKHAVGRVLPDLPDVLPPPSDPDGILDRVCALFNAFHIFETDTRPVTPEMLADSMALIVALLPTLLAWITAFTSDIIVTNKASEYTHDFYRRDSR